jgi:hypothetical protein
MNLNIYLGMLRQAEQTLARSFRQVADGHGAEPDVYFLCHTLAGQREQHGNLLIPVVQRYGEDQSSGTGRTSQTTNRSGCTPRGCRRRGAPQTRMKQAAPQALVAAR